MKENFKSGFISIVGAPNAGKSTLLNRLLGEKISITSDKAQTTRNRILGVLHSPTAQLIFLDTPGMHLTQNTFNSRMVESAVSAMSEADLILFIADASAPDRESEKLIVDKIKYLKKQVIIAINKVDLVKKQSLLEMIARWSERGIFKSIVPISAINGEQTDALLQEMETALPEGPPFFPDDVMTNMPIRFIAAEMVREKIFRLTGQEIPYSTAVTIEVFDESDPNIVRIHAAIHVERDSQKGIIIGKGGSKLKQIGENARKDIEQLVGTKVFLKLFVRVEKNWSRDTKSLLKFGY